MKFYNKYCNSINSRCKNICNEYFGLQMTSLFPSGLPKKQSVFMAGGLTYLVDSKEACYTLIAKTIIPKHLVLLFFLLLITIRQQQCVQMYMILQSVDWITKRLGKKVNFHSQGSLPMRKTVKKADNVRFGRSPPPKRVKSGHLLSEKARKSRQIRFRDKTAYVWGLGYR